MENFRSFMNSIEPVRLVEPLARTLGAFTDEEAVVEYRFTDTVKMAGHACPTVSSAFLACREALAALYPDTLPVRGGIRVTVHGEPDEGVYGVMAQVFGFITGAAPATGFKGLGREFKRKDLLTFVDAHPAGGACRFDLTRTDTGATVRVAIRPDRLPHLGEREQRMGRLMEKVLWDAAKDDERAEFRDLWMEKVEKIVRRQENIQDWLQIEKTGA